MRAAAQQPHLQYVDDAKEYHHFFTLRLLALSCHQHGALQDRSETAQMQHRDAAQHDDRAAIVTCSVRMQQMQQQQITVSARCLLPIYLLHP
jgi:hypothetical protein